MLTVAHGIAGFAKQPAHRRQLKKAGLMRVRPENMRELV